MAYAQDGEQVSNSGASNIVSSEGNTQPQHAQSLRLFVGWVPKALGEQELVGLFTQWGRVRDAIILRDKLTGDSRGCAFVSYGSREEADAAIAALDRKVHLPGALCPLEVRYARTHKYVAASEGPDDNRQLFFARASPTASEADMYQLFAAHGEVAEINLFRERRSGLSKACGFVVMGSRAAAVAAMNALDEALVMPGAPGPLSVKWADPELQLKKRRALEDEVGGDRKLFFAKVLRTASEEEVVGLFSRYGQVAEVNLFRAFQGAPTSKGCGLVTFSTPSEAAAAIAGLDAVYTWPGADGPMVVKWMDTALQRKRRDEHLAAMRQGLVPSMSMTPEMWLQLRNAQAVAAAVNSSSSGGERPNSALGPEPVESRPAGCAPDAYKLFIGNVPKSISEQQLRPLFEGLGQVMELVVVRDKASHGSKGSAFVWYATKAQADAAVAALHLRHVIPDPAGEVERPLVVRRANTRKTMGGWPLGRAGGPPGAPPHHLAMGGGGMQGFAGMGVGPGGRALLLAGGPPPGGPGGLVNTGDTLVPMGLGWAGLDALAGAGGGQHHGGGLLTDGSSMPSTSLSMPNMAMGSGAYAVIDTSQFADCSLSTLTAPTSFSGSGYATGGLPPQQQHQQQQQLVSGGQISASTDLLMRSGQGGLPLHSSSGAWLASPYPSGAQQQQLGPNSMGGMAQCVQGGHHSSGSNVLDLTGDSASLARSSYPLVGDLGGGGGGGGGGRVSLTLTLSSADLQTVSVHLTSLQTLSGVEVSSTGLGPGLFRVVLQGSPGQLGTAKDLLAGVLSPGVLAAATLAGTPQ